MEAGMNSVAFRRTDARGDGASLAGPPEGLPDLADLLARRQDKPPVVYLVNQYPAVTHTFIRREILALEQLGREVVRTSIRAAPQLVDPQDIVEKERTTELMRRPMALAFGLIWSAVAGPRGFLRAARLMLAASRRSDRSPAHHLAYLVEACGLARLIRRRRAAHVHAHFGTNPAEVAMLAAAMAGVGFSFTVHGYDEYDKPEFLALRQKIAQARFVACVSHYGRSQLLRWCDEGDRGKIHLVRCGLDLAALPAPSAEDGPRPARFVCVARLCREKAQETLLIATRLLRERGRRFELVIVGDGETRPALERFVAEYGLSEMVRFTGWLDGEGVRREMRAARALVVPSFAENLPVVMMEAMALHRPVIATMIAGIPELVIPGETGWLVPASAEEALADAMAQCLDCPDEELDRLGRQGRARVERFHDGAREAGKLAALFP
jgi:colanic acid/amylovoran biosynthesis glycosyltransferase